MRQITDSSRHRADVVIAAPVGPIEFGLAGESGFDIAIARLDGLRKSRLQSRNRADIGCIIISSATESNVDVATDSFGCALDLALQALYVVQHRLLVLILLEHDLAILNVIGQCLRLENLGEGFTKRNSLYLRRDVFPAHFARIGSGGTPVVAQLGLPGQFDHGILHADPVALGTDRKSTRLNSS